eukprot:2287265-Pleurochrysis_carterae.AAC.1
MGLWNKERAGVPNTSIFNSSNTQNNFHTKAFHPGLETPPLALAPFSALGRHKTTPAFKWRLEQLQEAFWQQQKWFRGNINVEQGRSGILASGRALVAHRHSSGVGVAWRGRGCGRWRGRGVATD